MQSKVFFLSIFFLLFFLFSFPHSFACTPPPELTASDATVYCEGQYVDPFFLEDIPEELHEFQNHVLLSPNATNASIQEIPSLAPVVPSDSLESPSSQTLPVRQQQSTSYTRFSIVGGIIFILLTFTLSILRKHHKQQRIRHYIQECREQGYTDEQITQTLQQQGYSQNYILKTYKSLDE